MNPNGVRVGELPGGWALGDLGGGTSMGPTLHISPSACSSGSFVLSFSNKPVTDACFPDFCDALYQINRPEEGVMRTSIWSEARVTDNLDL